MNNSHMTSLDREICGTIWASPHAQALMETLSYEIGPRPSGSKSMIQAQQLLAEELRQLGAESVLTEPVPVFTWRESPSRLELTSPRRRVYESIHAVRSAAGQVKAPLLDGGVGSMEALDRLGRRVEGAILLMGGHVISGAKFVPFPQQVRNIAERGAVGILQRSMYPVGGCPAIELVGVSQDASIPVLGVSYEAAHELSTLARQGKATVQLEASGTSASGECTNLVAELGPQHTTDEVIVLGAHLDSFYVNPGSLDNLTGVITVIETARALAPLRSNFRRRLRLLIYTGEEYGFLGSKSYVQRHARELESIQFVLNMDTIFPATAEGMAVMGSPAMRDYIDSAFRQTQRRPDVRNLFCMSSDYLPFVLQGIPAGRPADWRNSMPIWSHTRMDTPDKIHMDWLRTNAMTYAQLLARMLLDPQPLPAERKSPEEVRTVLENENVVEAIRSFDLDGLIGSIR